MLYSNNSRRQVQEKLRSGRNKFEELKVSLGNKWKQVSVLRNFENECIIQNVIL